MPEPKHRYTGNPNSERSVLGCIEANVCNCVYNFCSIFQNVQCFTISENWMIMLLRTHFRNFVMNLIDISKNDCCTFATKSTKTGTFSLEMESQSTTIRGEVRSARGRVRPFRPPRRLRRLCSPLPSSWEARALHRATASGWVHSHAGSAARYPAALTRWRTSPSPSTSATRSAQVRMSRRF